MHVYTDNNARSVLGVYNYRCLQVEKYHAVYHVTDIFKEQPENKTKLLYLPQSFKLCQGYIKSEVLYLLFHFEQTNVQR